MNCAGLELEWKRGIIFGLCPGVGSWDYLLPCGWNASTQFYNYCQCEETMGGMRWLSRSVRSLMAACLEGDRQAGPGILCLGLLYVCLTSSSAMR